MVSFADIEREAIALQAIVESLQAMVNHEIFSFGPGDTEIQATFTSSARLALFNVLLADMLELVDPALLGVEGSSLDVLQQIAEAP
jgi:hypothetical protein